MITIRECLEHMHAGEVFRLKVVSFDKKRPVRCGIVHEYPEAVLMWATAPDGSESAKAMPGERPMTELEKRLIGADAAAIARRPHHADHYTRNIRLLMHGQPTEAVVKIHPPLIIEFNGETTCP